MAVRGLMTATHLYLARCDELKKRPNPMVLTRSAAYVTTWLRMVGVIESAEEDEFGFPSQKVAMGNSAELLAPYEKTVADFKRSVLERVGRLGGEASP